MKIILILSILLISACGSLPDLPVIQYQYTIVMDKDYPWCVRYDVLSLDPYKIQNPVYLETKECSSLNGFKAKDMKSILNWISDAKKANEQKNLINGL